MIQEGLGVDGLWARDKECTGVASLVRENTVNQRGRHTQVQSLGSRRGQVSQTYKEKEPGVQVRVLKDCNQP